MRTGFSDLFMQMFRANDSSYFGNLMKLRTRWMDIRWLDSISDEMYHLSKLRLVPTSALAMG